MRDEEEERKEPRKRPRPPAPPPPARHSVRFPVDSYDAEARVAEYTQAHGHPPYCFLCKWVSGMDEAQQTAYLGLIKAYVDNFTQVDRVTLGEYIQAYYRDKFLDIVIAHEKEKLARAKEDKKMEKLNMKQTWTEEDEKAFEWNEAMAEKFDWPVCSILDHFDRYPTEEQVFKEIAWWAQKTMQTIVRGGLVQLDEKTNKRVIDRGENINLAVSYRIYRDATKNAQAKSKPKSA